MSMHSNVFDWGSGGTPLRRIFLKVIRLIPDFGRAQPQSNMKA